MEIELENLLEGLARLNYSGAPFLIAFGVTWTLCGWIWIRFNSRIASLASLFQGTVALPCALFLMFAIGAFKSRPDIGILNDLIIIISMSQLLVIPLLISMFMKSQFTLIPFIFSAAAAIHFVMYTWMYQTTSYIIMAVSIVIALAIVHNRNTEDEKVSAMGASWACFLTGAILFTNAIYLVFSQIN